MKVFGITGLLGSGKSTAVQMLRELGYDLLDADELSKKLVDKNTELGKEGFSRIYKSFGPTVLNSLGQLDRTAMRKRILANPHERTKLEELINPLLLDAVRRQMTQWKADGCELAFIEGARLIESGLDKVVFQLIQVTAPEADRIKRIVKRDSMGKDEATMLVQLQDQGLMSRLCKVEWKNNGKVKDLETIVHDFLKQQLGL